jgi:hypothetical protein
MTVDGTEVAEIMLKLHTEKNDLTYEIKQNASRSVMEQVQIVRKVNNLEIISKLMNSVAKQCGCRVKYNADEGGINFYGDAAYQKYIVEETLSFFQAA